MRNENGELWSRKIRQSWLTAMAAAAVLFSVNPSNAQEGEVAAAEAAPVAESAPVVETKAPAVEPAAEKSSAAAPETRSAPAAEPGTEKAKTSEAVADKSKKSNCRRCNYAVERISSLYFAGGVGFFSLDAINGRLGDAGYSEIDSPSIPLGVGFNMRHNRFVSGFDWYWVANAGADASSPDYSLDYKANYWLFRYGFDVVRWKGLSVYPLLSIGAGHMKIRISEETGTSFNEVLANPARETEMSQTSLLLDASLGIDYRFTMHESEKKTSYLTLGVRGGYMFQPYAGEWETNSAEISGGPEKGLQGPVVQLLIGISGKRHPRPAATK